MTHPQRLLLFGLCSIALLTIKAREGYAGIQFSDHDFSGYGWSGGQICMVCHTPHNSDMTVVDAPLWNHAVTTATFTPYASATLDATDVGQPNGPSKLCLSCHDGTVGLGDFGGVTGTPRLNPSEPEMLGLDNRDDHPVSFTYDQALALADGELADPADNGDGTVGPGNLPLWGPAKDKMECSSCHDVHNGPNLRPLLRMTTTGSAICLNCHLK